MATGASEATQTIDDGKPKRHPSRGMYVLPSLFTAGNIAAGYYAITQSVQGSIAEPAFFDHAALAIGFAVLFDGLDGRIARMTNTTSDFGKELDSLADVITFGVAPSLLAYIWGFRMLPLLARPHLRDQIVHVGVFVCFIFLICGASRLARFNISINPQPRNPGRPGKKYFVGMPIPAGAGVLASVIHFENGSPIYEPMDGRCVAMSDPLYRLSDGQQLAFLEWQGDQPGQPSSVPACCCAGCHRCVGSALFRVHADRYCAGVSRVWRCGAAGVLVEQGTAASHGVSESPHGWLGADRSVAGEL